MKSLARDNLIRCKMYSEVEVPRELSVDKRHPLGAFFDSVLDEASLCESNMS